MGKAKYLMGYVLGLGMVCAQINTLEALPATSNIRATKQSQSNVQLQKVKINKVKPQKLHSIMTCAAIGYVATIIGRLTYENPEAIAKFVLELVIRFGLATTITMIGKNVLGLDEKMIISAICSLNTPIIR